MIRVLIQASVFAATLFGTASAQSVDLREMGQGVILRFGEGSAESCYRAAAERRSAGLGECTRALDRDLLDPRNRAATFVNRGILYLARGEQERALADFNRAIVTDPRLAEAYTHRGLAQLMLRNYQAAVTDITHGLSMTPGPAETHKAYYTRAVAYEELGNIRAAYADYRHANELAPQWDPARSELSRFQVRHPQTN